MSNKMSGVSRSSKFSKFSVKSQQVIAAQDVKIAAMRKLLVEAGIDPDSVVPIQDSRVSVQPNMTTSKFKKRITEVSASRAVQVLNIVCQIVQVRYARHSRYNLYVQSMKATKAKMPPVQAPVQAPSRAGYPTLVVQVAQVAQVALVQALVQAPVQASLKSLNFQSWKLWKLPKLPKSKPPKAAKVDEVAQMVSVVFVAPVVLVPVRKVSYVALVAKLKYKFQFKTKFKFKWKQFISKIQTQMKLSCQWNEMVVWISEFVAEFIVYIFVMLNLAISMQE